MFLNCIDVLATCFWVIIQTIYMCLCDHECTSLCFHSFQACLVFFLCFRIHMLIPNIKTTGVSFFEDLMVNHLCVFRYHVLLFKTFCTHNWIKKFLEVIWFPYWGFSNLSFFTSLFTHLFDKMAYVLCFRRFSSLFICLSVILNITVRMG